MDVSKLTEETPPAPTLPNYPTRLNIYLERQFRLLYQRLLKAIEDGTIGAPGPAGPTGPAGPVSPAGTGTTNYLPRFTDGPAGIIADSSLHTSGGILITSEPFKAPELKVEYDGNHHVRIVPSGVAEQAILLPTGTFLSVDKAVLLKSQVASSNLSLRRSDLGVGTYGLSVDLTSTTVRLNSNNDPGQVQHNHIIQQAVAGSAGSQLLEVINASGVAAIAVDQNTDTLLTGQLKLTTVGKGLFLKEGTNATMGVAVLVAGAVTVPTTRVTANSRIFLTVNGVGVLANLGSPYENLATRVAGTSFDIKSSNVLDTSTVAWLLLEPS